MAMTATLVQTETAILSSGGTTFVLTVANSSGSQVNVNSIQPTITTQNGLPLGPSLPCNIGAIVAPGSQPSVAQVGGSQFNVPVPATGSTIFTFNIQFFGPAINGGPTQPSSVFLVAATVQSSDGSVFSSNALIVDLNTPVWGQFGSPPNLVPVPGQLIFSTVANGGLAMCLAL
jgi:hypothetical protein